MRQNAYFESVLVQKILLDCITMVTTFPYIKNKTELTIKRVKYTHDFFLQMLNMSF